MFDRGAGDSMIDAIPHPIKMAANGAAYIFTATSVIGTWFQLVQPIVAVFAGLAGGTWACMQAYDWTQKKLRGHRKWCKRKEQQ